VDQRKIFTLAAENLPKVGFKERAHLMNPMVPGLAGGKMSASDPNSKIDLLDKPEVVKSKLKKAVCAPNEAEGNGVLSFVEYVLFPIAELSGKNKFHVPRPEKYGGPLDFSSFETLKVAYVDGTLQPGDLKAGVEQALNALLAPIQEDYAKDPEFRKVAELAYPPEQPDKKKKKEKKIGTGYASKDKQKGAATAATVAGGRVKPEEAVAKVVGTGAEDAMERPCV